MENVALSDTVQKHTGATAKRKLPPGDDGGLDAKKPRSNNAVKDAGKRKRSSGPDDGKQADTKRRKIFSYHNSNEPASRKRLRSSGDDSDGRDALRLVLEPPASPAKRRGLSLHGRHIYLDVRPSNKVTGSVNGRACPVVLDCGASASFMCFSQAKALGLLTGGERTERMPVSMWYGTVRETVILLDEVSVILDGKVEVRTPFIVLPKRLEKYEQDPKELILGLPVLQSGSTVQVFGLDNSRLYIRRPKSMRARRCWRRLQSLRERPMQLSFWVRGPRPEARLLYVLVDTGAEGGFCVSPAARAVVTTHEESDPRRVVLDLGGGKCLEAEPLETVPQKQLDFVMGEAVLKKYQAVLDYSSRSLVLKVVGRHLKVDLSGG